MRHSHLAFLPSFARTGRRLALLLGLALGQTTGLVAQTAVEPSSALAVNDPLRDLRLTVRARQAVQQDTVLAGLGTINVSVRAGVATIWGVVPSADLARRAVERVGQVQGIFESRNELEVRRSDDALAEFLRTPALKPKAEPERLWFMANRPPVPLTGQLEVEAPPEQPAPAPDVALLAPIRLGSPQPAEAPREPKLIEEIARLQRTDLRFQTVQVEVQGGLVRLRPAGTRREHVFELAHALSRLPGVERVLLQD